jgi:hypothetical protein
MDQRFVDDFDNLLTRRQTFQDFRSERLLADFVRQFLDDAIIDIGFEQSETNLAHHVFDIFFRHAALTAHRIGNTPES